MSRGTVTARRNASSSLTLAQARPLAHRQGGTTKPSCRSRRTPCSSLRSKQSSITPGQRHPMVGLAPGRVLPLVAPAHATGLPAPHQRQLQLLPHGNYAQTTGAGFAWLGQPQQQPLAAADTLSQVDPINSNLTAAATYGCTQPTACTPAAHRETHTITGQPAMAHALVLLDYQGHQPLYLPDQGLCQYDASWSTPARAAPRPITV